MNKIHREDRVVMLHEPTQVARSYGAVLCVQVGSSVIELTQQEFDDLTKLLVKESDDRALQISVGNIVAPIYPNANPLRSGAEWYLDAVVVQMEPFVLVSRETDMMWCVSVKAEDYKVIGQASEEMLKACMKRLE